MKRDLRLHGLSNEHHHALRLAKRLSDASRGGRADEASVRAVRDRFDAELAPHFAAEEEVLLPALMAVGEEGAARRTLEEHAALRAHLAAAEAGERSRLADFAALLGEHVRFEERELFDLCERRLPSEVLDRLAARSPKPGEGGDDGEANAE